MAGTHPDARKQAPRRFSFASDKHRPPHELKIVVEKQYRGNRITIELPVQVFRLAGHMEISRGRIACALYSLQPCRLKPEYRRDTEIVEIDNNFRECACQF
jgi:hypothetical protein